MRYFNFGRLQKSGSTNHQGKQLVPGFKSPHKEHSLSALRLIKQYCTRAWEDETFGAIERDGFYNSIDHLSVAKPKNDDVTVVLSCDSAYFLRFARYFITTHFASGNESPIHLLLTLPTREALRVADDLLASPIGQGLSISIAEEKYFSDLVYTNVFLTSARFIFNTYVQSRNRSVIFNSDVDGLVKRKYEHEIIEKMKGVDVCAVSRDYKLRPSRRILAAALATSNSSNGLHFNDALSRALVKILQEGPTYHIDQTAIYYLIRRADRDGLNVRPMDDSFVDNRFLNESFIWTAKGKSGKENPRFLAALENACQSHDALIENQITTRS